MEIYDFGFMRKFLNAFLSNSVESSHLCMCPYEEVLGIDEVWVVQEIPFMLIVD